MKSLRLVVVSLLLTIACSGNKSAAHSSRPAGGGIVITAEEIERSPGMSLEQLLMARVPGLTFARSEQGYTIITFPGGTNTVMGEKAVLVVVNGIALGPSGADNLHAINIHDVDSITVLRDAAVTAQYGTRGANGVILIRTKQG